MKTIICWFPQSTYTNQDCKQLLIDNNICPMLDSSYATEIWLELERLDTLRTGDFIPIDDDAWRTDIEVYIDEPLSTNHYKPNDSGFKLLCKADNVTIGETSTETIQQLIDTGCKSITYTSYGWHLFRIFGLNIRMPFSNQIRTWEYLMSKYPDKFHFCWIMLDQARDFKKLIKWCKQNGNAIGLVAPDDWKNDPSKVLEGLKKFTEVYKSIK